MTAHLSDSDRQALRLAHDLREELRQALPAQTTGPSVSPFVDPAGRPSVLMRMDAETARALMALLGERRMQTAPPPEPRRADGTHVPPPAGEMPMGHPMSATPYGAPVPAGHIPAQAAPPAYAPPMPPPAPGAPLIPTPYPSY